jgi:hypothetical protein
VDHCQAHSFLLDARFTELRTSRICGALPFHVRLVGEDLYLTSNYQLSRFAPCQPSSRLDCGFRLNGPHGGMVGGKRLLTSPFHVLDDASQSPFDFLFAFRRLVNIPNF